MAGMLSVPHDLEITLSVRQSEEVMHFLRFLRKSARKHSVTISFTNCSDKLALSVPTKERLKLESFLQELLLTGGLHYYLCSVSNRRQIARSVVKPIFEQFRLQSVSPLGARNFFIGLMTGLSVPYL